VKMLQLGFRWWVLMKQNQCKKNYPICPFRILVIAKTVAKE
jgi:hypothetical protein